MNLPLRFAFRYLFARKSYNVINMISGIGMVGMAVGTAALIVILSVFNGFRDIVSKSLDDARGDLQIKPSAGKVFDPSSLEWLLEDERIISLSSVLEEQVFVSYEGTQKLARVKGIDSVGEETSPLKEHVVDGKWALEEGGQPRCIAGANLAFSLGVNPRFVTPLEIHYPSRKLQISVANPAASLRSVKVRLGGVVSVDSDSDASVLIVPIVLVRDLLEYPAEVSSLEICSAQGQTEVLKKELTERLGPSFRVLDRFQQDESLYRMMRYEKLAIFLILIFIVLIIAFNVYSSLKMLVIEKQGDVGTLRSLGAPEPMLRSIFLMEGWLVSLVGMLAGLVLGILLVFLQQKTGLVGMPGNYVIDAYPVSLKAWDIIGTIAGVGLVGFLMAFIPSRKI